jgi:hypothetical protein
MAKQPRQRATPEEARAAYERARQSIIARVKDPEKQKKALLAYDSDPRIQTIRGLAGMPFVSTRLQDRKKAAPNLTPEKRQEAVQEAVRRTIEQQKEANRNSIIPESVRDYGAGLLGSANDMFLGLPAFAAAKITGTDNDLMQEYARQQGQRAPVTNFLGTLAGSVFTGGGLLRGGAALAGGLARSGTPALARTGQVLQSGGKAMTLKKGENLKNAGRLAAGGATFGATESAIKDENIAKGAAFGAGGAVALGAGFKAGSLVAGKASDVLRQTGADAFIKRYTTTTREELQKRLDDFRARGQAEPTFYELLNLKDRQALSARFARLDAAEQERAASLARARVEAVPSEVAQVARKATRDQRRSNINNLATAQATARGAGDPTTAEMRLAVGAADNPTRLAQLRENEAASIMRPFDNQRAVDDVSDLIPTEMRALDPNKPGEISEVEVDPEMSSMIRAAAGLARIRPEGEGLSVRELTSMIRKLKEIARTTKDAIQQGNAQRAVDHLENQLRANVPGVGSALERMNAAWAARSRQLEGMRETRTQADVDVSTSQRLRKSENVFETPEGAVGRQAGQRAELLDDLGRRPDVALGTVRNLADDATEQSRIAQNIGRPAQQEISAAAKAQSDAVKNLAAAIRDPDFRVDEVTAGDLATVAAGFLPGSMVQTKGRAIATLWQRFGEGLSPNRSRTIVDMLFSRDPSMTLRAMKALQSEGSQGLSALRDITAMVASGAAGQNLFAEDSIAPMPADTEIETPEAVEEPVEVLSEEDAYLDSLPPEELFQMLEEAKAREAENPRNYDDYLDSLPPEELFQMLEDLKAEESAKENLPPYMRDM